MAQLYRKSALERLSSPEQLDKALKVSSPLSWLVLIGIALIIAVTVVWSIIGTIPVTVTASGTIVIPTSVQAIYTEEAGTVDRIFVSPGDTVHMGDPVIAYHALGGSETKYIFADQFGTVASVKVTSGGTMEQGNEAVRISPIVTGRQVALCYIPVNDAKKVKPGMKAHVFLSAIDSQTYGYIIGRVYGIDTRAATNNGMKEALGSDNSLYSDYLKNGSVVAFVCEFYPDETAQSNYYWSNEKGKTQTVDTGASVSVKVVVEEIPPINKLFSKIKDIWSGGKNVAQ